MPVAASQVVGIDDAPFARRHRGDVLIVGAVYAGRRLEGVLSSRVRRDGANATDRVHGMIGSSRFVPQLQAVMLQGIAFAGFNVVDIHALHERLGVPVLVVSRKQPDLAAIRRALLERVPGGERKWRVIVKAGPMEALRSLWVQRAGLDRRTAESLLRRHAIHGHMPEPLRAAHMIAGGVTEGESRHRP